jgi:hypothetical protein
MRRVLIFVLLFSSAPLLSAQKRVPVRWVVTGLEEGLLKGFTITVDSTGADTKVLEALLFDFGCADVTTDDVKVLETEVSFSGHCADRKRPGVAAMIRFESEVPIDTMMVPAEAERWSVLTEAVMQFAKEHPVSQRHILEQVKLAPPRQDTLYAQAFYRRMVSNRLGITNGEKMPMAFLERLSGLNQPRPVTEARLSEVRRTLQSSGFFTAVDEGQLVVRDTHLVAQFRTQNLPLNTFDAVLGWIPRARGGGTLAGNAQLRARSVLWEGDLLQFRYNRDRPAVSQLELEHQAEFLWGTPFGFAAGARFFQRDSTYLLRGFFAQPMLRLSPFSRLGFSLRTEASSGNQRVVGGTIPVTRSVLTGVVLEHRAVDDLFMPRRGLMLHALMERGRKRADGAEDAVYSGVMQRAQIQLQFFVPTGARWVAATTVRLDGGHANQYSQTDLVRFGGAQSLRGYQEQQFEGVKTGWADLEWRFMPTREVYFFAFGATGRYERLELQSGGQQRTVWSEWLRSGGFGLADRTRLGLLRVSYAFNSGAGGGLVHVSLRNGF